jgi:hypothetical protein
VACLHFQTEPPPKPGQWTTLTCPQAGANLENKKKRPLAGPPFSKRRSGRESEETLFGAALGSRTDRVGSMISIVKLLQRVASSAAIEISTCRTKIVNPDEAPAPFWEPVQNQSLRMNFPAADKPPDHPAMPALMHKAAHWPQHRAALPARTIVLNLQPEFHILPKIQKPPAVGGS